MQFHVPQFIDVEDKIFGPLSAKQFAWVGGSFGAFFAAFSLTDSFFLGLIISSPVVALGLALAFYKINNRSFVYVAEAAFKYIMASRLYIWKRKEKKAVAKVDESEVSSDLFVPKLSDSKLKDLAFSLDIQEGGVYVDKNKK